MRSAKSNRSAVAELPLIGKVTSKSELGLSERSAAAQTKLTAERSLSHNFRSAKALSPKLIRTNGAQRKTKQCKRIANLLED